MIFVALRSEVNDQPSGAAMPSGEAYDGYQPTGNLSVEFISVAAAPD